MRRLRGVRPMFNVGDQVYVHEYTDGLYAPGVQGTVAVLYQRDDAAPVWVGVDFAGALKPMWCSYLRGLLPELTGRWLRPHELCHVSTQLELDL